MTTKKAPGQGADTQPPAATPEPGEVVLATVEHTSVTRLSAWPKKRDRSPAAETGERHVDPVD